MRTTLDIDDDVLQAAKERARMQRTTTGRVVSDLVRRALTTREGHLAATLVDGWYVLPDREGLIVSPDLVERIADQANREDATPDRD